MLLPILFALLPQDAPVQGPPAPAPTPPEAGAKDESELVNGIYLVVNEEVVTFADLYRELRRRNLSLGTEEERRRARMDNHADFVRRMLMTQAGRDLGFDPERVRAMVDDEMKDMVDQAGSAIEFGAGLRASNLAPDELREQREAYWYSQLWLGAINGNSQGASGRPYVDRFVRPGKLLCEYRQQTPEELFPRKITLQELDVDCQRAGGAPAALELAKSLRERALKGEDFTELVVKYSHGSQPELKGMLRPVDLPRAKQMLPEMSEFLDHAQAGQIAEPLPIRVDGELVGFILLRVVQLDDPRTPTFTELAVQDQLRERVTGKLSEWRRNTALVDLYQASYIWPPEARPKNNAAGGR